MVDRVSLSPNRRLIKPETGAQYYARLLRADEPVDIGTPLIKSTLIRDRTASLFGLSGTNATVNNALSSIKNSLTAHVGAVGSVHGNASVSVSGFMSPSQYTLLNTVNTNLNAHIGSTGNSHGSVSAITNGFMSSALYTLYTTTNTNQTAHIGMTGNLHGAATTSVNGFMTSTQYTTYTNANSNLTAHIGGTGSAHGTANNSVNGFMSSYSYSILNSIDSKTAGVTTPDSYFGPVLIGSRTPTFSASMYNCAITVRPSDSSTSSSTVYLADSAVFGSGGSFYNSSLNYSCVLGRRAISNNSDFTRNTIIGTSLEDSYNPVAVADPYSYSTWLGGNTQVTGNNEIQLGGRFSIGAGIYGIVYPYAWSALQNRSDERDKADIRDTIHGMDFIRALRPIDYRWYYRGSSQKGTRYHHGLIAQDVAKIIEETGNDFGGYQDHKINGGEDVLSIGYEELIAPVVKAFQELSERYEKLLRRIS